MAIVKDADVANVKSVASTAIGILSTEQRKTWANLRSMLQRDRSNAAALQIVDNALFIVCLDDAAPDNLAELCGNYLCGTYKLEEGVQVGTCTNRWYDKVSELLAYGVVY
jgi:carnitine O-acetyltransferase